MGGCQSTAVAKGTVNNTSADTLGTGQTGKSDPDINSRFALSRQQSNHQVGDIPRTKFGVTFRKDDASRDGSGVSKSEQFKNRPGYSSGGSSSIGDSFDEEMLNLPARCGSRHDKLCQWKKELASTGDLSSNVVRIEVRSFSYSFYSVVPSILSYSGCLLFVLVLDSD
jgi:hypothetical protein